MRLIEHSPKRWAVVLKTDRPLTESIIPLDSRERRKWSAMSDSWLVGYVQRIVDMNGITSRSGLKNAEGGLYGALKMRNLVNKVRFKSDVRAWRFYSDEGLVGYAQKFVDGNGINSKAGLRDVDGGLYDALKRRHLIGRIRFKGGLRSWSRLSDKELIEHAQKFVDGNEVESRGALLKIDRGLYGAIVRRNLISKVKFKADGRAWCRYSDDKLVAYAQRFVDENEIKSRVGLEKIERGLYDALNRRKLSDRLRFKADERAWRLYSDEELVAYAQKYVDENGIGSRWQLRRSDGGLHQTLRKRNILGKVNFKSDGRAWRLYSDEELVDYAQKFADGNKIESLEGLKRADRGLFETLRRRKLHYMLKMKVFSRRWSKLSDAMLVKYAQEFVDENKIEGKSKLEEADSGLYTALRRRKLLHELFFDAIKQREQHGLKEISDAMSEFSDDD